MTSNNESQCYFVQLQFDSYIDGDLNDAQIESFLQHINGCEECAQEFRYAQTVQDGLLDLPLLDCAESTLGQVQLAARSSQAAVKVTGSWVHDLFEWISATPPLVRYAFPALAVALVGLITLPSWQPSSSSAPQLVAEQNDSFSSPLATIPVNYSPAEIAQAMQELNLAIEYLNQVTQRTEALVGNRFLITPLRDRLNASFERVQVIADDESVDDQIF